LGCEGMRPRELFHLIYFNILLNADRFTAIAAISFEVRPANTVRLVSRKLNLPRKNSSYAQLKIANLMSKTKLNGLGFFFEVA
jgi:hypothetical protein